jgi:formylglycine-generating enzyme
LPNNLSRMKYIFSLILLLFIVLQSANAQTAARKGKDYAVFFYVTEFDQNQTWDPLPETQRETELLAKELRDNFGFACEFVRNPTLSQIKTKLKEYNNRVYDDNDQVLFFFSMHGYYDADTETGFLIPKDGDSKDFETWFNYFNFRSYLATNNCRHIYLALDACYSGSFKTGDKGRPDKMAWENLPDCQQSITEALRLKSRIFAAAGNKAARTPAKSTFAAKFLETLRTGGENGIIKADEINFKLKGLSSPRPETGSFTGHEDGEFVFIRKTACVNQPTPPSVPSPNFDADKADWKDAKTANSIVVYEMYKRNHPSGLYYEEAQDAINRLKQASVPLPNNQRQDNNSNSAPRIVPPSVTRLPFEPEMVEVQGGTFQMGSNEYDNEKPVHSVSVSPFYIGKYEVTQKQWRDVMGTNPSYFRYCDDCPVEEVSWEDVQEYLRKLNSKATGKNYRLLTEAEWEFAARGGNKSNTYIFSGSNNLDEVAWYFINSGNKTHPVGGKRANELGIYDMSGNVWEWCSDWFQNYSVSIQENPTSAAFSYIRINRGGSIGSYVGSHRSAFRFGNTISSRFTDVGFRVGYSLP